MNLWGQQSPDGQPGCPWRARREHAEYMASQNPEFAQLLGQIDQFVEQRGPPPAWTGWREFTRYADRGEREQQMQLDQQQSFGQQQAFGQHMPHRQPMLVGQQQYVYDQPAFGQQVPFRRQQALLGQRQGSLRSQCPVHPHQTQRQEAEALARRDPIFAETLARFDSFVDEHGPPPPGSRWRGFLRQGQLVGAQRGAPGHPVWGEVEVDAPGNGDSPFFTQWQAGRGPGGF